MKVYTVKEVSEILKVDSHVVYKLIKDGKLIAFKLGSLRIKEEELINYLNTL